MGDGFSRCSFSPSFGNGVGSAPSIAPGLPFVRPRAQVLFTMGIASGFELDDALGLPCPAVLSIAVASSSNSLLTISMSRPPCSSLLL